MAWYLLAASLVSFVAADFSLFSTDVFPTSISAGCASALNATVSCDPYLMDIAYSDYYGSIDNATHTSVCTPSCSASLASYRSAVLKACQSTPQPWTGIPSTFYGDLVASTYNLTCLKDPASGQWCTDYISSIDISSDTSIASLNKTTQCSPCILALFQHIQSTAYSGYNDDLATDWAAIQKTCGVSFPTAVQPPVANVTVPGYTNFSGTASCLSGKSYTVVSGDNCESIAEKQSVDLGTLIVVNSLLPDCSDLLGGQVLCLPQTCKTYKVASGDTCAKIAGQFSISLQALYSFNPTLAADCSNLIAGTTICVGSTITPWNGTAIPGATPTQTAIYATATVSSPNPLAHGTTTQCGKYYQVQSGDICQNVALNNTIAISLFEAINPSINSDCSNLIPGLWYCILPTENWNATTIGNPTSTIVAPPAPTPPGTTSQCFQWHVVQSGDSCFAIENTYGVTMAQLQSWNPDLKTDCSNLLLNEAYCVSGPSSTVQALLSPSILLTTTISKLTSASKTTALPKRTASSNR